MPFQPYNGGGGQDPLQTLFALQQLKQSMAEQEARRREQALAVGMKLIEAGGGLEGVDPQVRQMLTPVAQAVQQDRQRTGLNTALQYAQPIAQAATPYYDEKGNLVQPDQQAAAGALRQLGGGLQLNPQTQSLLETLTGQAVQGGTAAQRAARAEEIRRRNDAMANIAASGAESRRSAAFSNDLQVRENQRREKLAQDEQVVESFATRIAAVQSGIAPPQEATAVAEEMARFNDPGLSRRVASLANQKKYDQTLSLLRTEGANTANIEAAADVLGISSQQVRAMNQGYATWDPATASVAPIQVGKSWAEKRISLVQAAGELQGVEDAFYRAQAEAQTDPLAGGPIVGADAFQRFLQATGQQNSAAAEYQSRMASYLLSVSNALVPGVPSNLDMRFVLVQLPTLEELFAGSAEGRFRALNDIQRIAIEAPHNTALGAQINSMKNDSRGLPEANKLVSDFLATGDVAAFNENLRAYKSKYRQRFTVPGVGGGPDGSESSDSFTDSFIDSQLGGK